MHLSKTLPFRTGICFLVLLGIVFFPLPGRAKEGESFRITEQGKPLVPIVIRANASPEMRKLAGELADGLRQISGAEFLITEDASGPGIFLGTAEDWPGMLPAPPAELESGLTREDYVLKSGDDFLYLVGRTFLGTQNAVWDFFHRLGFRQFFPGKNWEIWPQNTDLAIRMDEFQSPSYFQRLLLNGGGLDRRLPEDALQAAENWRRRNRMVSGFQVNAGHIYGEIIGSNPEHFSQHPEDIIGTGSNAKLDPSRQGTLDVAAQFALDELKKNPDLDTVSMAPSDGRENWRADSPLGSPSNQAITLANYVARTIQDQYPGKKVALLAYAASTDPPDIPVDKNVIIKVSVYGRTGGRSISELLKLWKERGAEVGVEDPVFSVWRGNEDLPGTSRADIDYLTKSIPENYADGARYWGGRTSPAWAPFGIAYYVASRLLWNLEESKKVDGILDDFFDKSFEGAAPPMREFYKKYLFASARPMLCGDLVGRMYRKLAEALEKPASEAAKSRIRDFVCYVRYLELYLAYSNAQAKERQESYETLAGFARRCEKSGNYMFSTYAAINWIPKTDKGVKIWEAPPDENFDPLSEDEILEMMRQGIAHNEPVDFEPVSFSENLVPYPGDGNPAGTADGSFVTYGDNSFYVFADRENTELEFEVAGGIKWPDRGPVKLRLFANKNVVVDKPVAEAEIPADKQPHTVKLKTPYSGLHRLEFGDASIGGTQISWKPGQHVAIPCSLQSNVRFASDLIGDVVFYVPKDTTIIGGYLEKSRGRLIAPDGKIALDFKQLKSPGYFSVPVKPGQTDAWWKLEKTWKKVCLLTVPPYLSRSAAEGLVPEGISENKP